MAQLGKGAQPSDSNLAKTLLQSWAWGQMSAPHLQTLAAAAHQVGLKHKQIELMAKLGGGGHYPGNMQRELLLLSGHFTTLPDVFSAIKIRLQPKPEIAAEVPLTFLLPHKLFASMYHHTPSAFEASILGGAASNIGKFWRAIQKHPIFTSRPSLQQRPDLHKVVPLAVHGDGVAYMQAMKAGGKSMEVLSWSSLLAQGPTRVSTFLMFLVVKAVVKDSGMGQTWPRVWKILCWSLQALAAGVWPLQDWDQQDFAPDSVDFEKAGTPLANGYSGFVFVLRSDLELLALHFKLNNATSNSPCALRLADRDPNSRPWTDVRVSAEWRKTCWDASAWAREHPHCHPFFSMPGSGIDLVYPDLMHCKHLGTDQVLLGLVRMKHYLRGTVAQNLDIVWSYIQHWYKETLTMPPPPGMGCDS